MKSAKAPAEDPAEKAARERDRRLAELARGQTVADEADDLTGDLREVYGLRRLGKAQPAPMATAAPRRTGSPTYVDGQKLGLQPDGSFTVGQRHGTAGSAKAPMKAQNLKGDMANLFFSVFRK